MRYQEWRTVDPTTVDWPRLTERQAAVVALAIAGTSQARAARMLGIGRQTLREHLEAAERRLNLRLEAA